MGAYQNLPTSPHMLSNRHKFIIEILQSNNLLLIVFS
jgi:hypothetical protein